MTLPGSYQINDSKRATAGTSQPRRAWTAGRRLRLLPFQLRLQDHARSVRLLDADPGGRRKAACCGCWRAIRCLRKISGAKRREQGIDPARLIFAPPLPLEAHLARLALGDLFLDSLPLQCPYHRQRRAMGRAAAAHLPRQRLSGPGRGQPAACGRAAGTGDGKSGGLRRLWRCGWRGDPALLKRYRSRLAETGAARRCSTPPAPPAISRRPMRRCRREGRTAKPRRASPFHRS